MKKVLLIGFTLFSLVLNAYCEEYKLEDKGFVLAAGFNNNVKHYLYVDDIQRKTINNQVIVEFWVKSVPDDVNKYFENNDSLVEVAADVDINDFGYALTLYQINPATRMIGRLQEIGYDKQGQPFYVLGASEGSIRIVPNTPSEQLFRAAIEQDIKNSKEKEKWTFSKYLEATRRVHGRY